MVLHLIKLSVGSETVDDLANWQERVIASCKAQGMAPLPFHDTRMFPKQAAPILAGGSLYWVIKHRIRCRQKILALERHDDAQGKGFCRIVLDPEIVETELRPKRPFQGWRYLKPDAAPKDRSGASAYSGDLSHGLEAALKEACVW